MITIDYSLKRDETDQVVTFTPTDSLKRIPNLALIEGPNSSGKSTLLHLMALAFGGKNNPGISESLKGKLNALSNNEYQELSFEIVIEDGRDRLQFLRNETTDYKCQAYWIENGAEKGIPLSEEALNRRYYLLYDIPEDPIGRLKMLTNTIKHSQSDLKNKMQILIGNINRTLSDIENSKNPEKIKELDKDIEQYATVVSVSSRKQENIREKYEVLKKYVDLRNHQKAYKKLGDLKRELANLESRKPKEGARTTGQRENAVFARARRFVESIQTGSDEIYERLEIYKDLRPVNYSEWQSYNFQEMIDACSVSETIISIVDETYEKAQERIDRQKVSEADREKFMLIGRVLELLSELEKYESADFDMEASARFQSFIQLMEEEQRRLHVPDDIDRIEEIRDLCKQVSTDLNIFKNEIIAQLIEEKLEDPEGDSMSPDEYEEKHKGLLKKIKEETVILEHMHDICIKNQVDPDDDYSKEGVFSALEIFGDGQAIRVASSKEWQDRLELLQHELSGIETQLANQEELLRRRKIQKEELERKPVHSYYLEQKKIRDISQNCSNIARKLEFYGQYLEKIKRKENSDTEDPEYQEYIDSIGRYLAKVIGEIQHIDGRYSLESVDLLNDKFETKTGKTIRFSDMGTGQGQSTYLMSQLKNAEISEKKVVALFDEIALMDSNSLSPIKSEMARLNREGKLLTGIMVQRNDDGISVKEIGE